MTPATATRRGRALRTASAPILVVALAVAVAELLRVSFPLLYRLAEDLGFLTAAAVVPLLFALPLLAVPVGRLVGPRLMLGVTSVVVGTARVAAQVQPTPTLVVVLVGALVGLVAIPLAMRVTLARHGPATATTAVFVGLGIDAGIRLAFVTWDPSWQSDIGALVTGLVVGLAVVAAAIATAVTNGGVAGPSWGGDRVRVGLVVGPILALQTLALASPGFVASSSGLGLAAAGGVVLVGLALAGAGPLVVAVGGRGVVVVAAVVVVVVAVVATGPGALGGWVVVPVVLVAQAATGVLAMAAMAAAGAGGPSVRDRPDEDRPDEDRPDVAHSDEERRDETMPWAWRTALGAGIGSLVLVGTLLPYQISYELELGAPQPVWPAVAAVVVGAGALATRARGWAAGAADGRGLADQQGAGFVRAGVAGVLGLLVVPVALAVTDPAPDPRAGTDAEAASSESRSDGTPMRVATYNLHSGVGVDGRLDPERIAQVLASGGAEVMALQEVSRGWPLGGGLDLGSWLARRLAADMAFGPAADRQFGNAVLSTRPIDASRTGTMPRGQGPMRRGWVAATVPFGDATLDVFSVHLQHQDDTTETRRAQAALVLEAWDGAAGTVLAGDLNSRPGSADIEPWFDDTGLVSAQDSQSEPPSDTSPAGSPDHRIDWILGTPDLVFSDVEVPETTASDHLPIFTDVAHR